MSCYISSNNNRVYVGLETSYGVTPGITTSNRIPLVKLGAKQVPEQTSRRDKTGSRTFAGLPNRIRKNTTFQLNTFMTEWVAGAPSHGPLFQAAMGGTPLAFGGGTVASVTGTSQIAFSAAHGLVPGQGVKFGAEIRFVTSVVNSTTVVVNAPFTNGPTVGGSMGPTMTYPLATRVGSVSIFDYWDPTTVVQRIVNGAAIDSMKVKVNGDFQEFEFAGPARDLEDSASYDGTFPAEPTPAGFDYTIVPGHLGQVWLGSTMSRFYTLTAAEMTLNNNIALRVKEFGSDFARCIAAGERSVKLNFKVFEQDDAQTKALYQSARARSTIGVMMQLGADAGQLFGVYMPAMVPEVPQFDDSETRLEWSFVNSRAQGSVDDELYVAFG